MFDTSWEWIESPKVEFNVVCSVSSSAKRYSYEGDFDELSVALVDDDISDLACKD